MYDLLLALGNTARLIGWLAFIGAIAFLLKNFGEYRAFLKSGLGSIIRSKIWNPLIIADNHIRGQIKKAKIAFWLIIVIAPLLNVVRQLLFSTGVHSPFDNETIFEVFNALLCAEALALMIFLSIGSNHKKAN